MTNSLERAFHAAANAMTERDRDFLAAVGVSSAWADFSGLLADGRHHRCLGRQLVGALPISVFGGGGDGLQGAFQWDDEGKRSVVVPVGFSCGVWWDCIDDLVAFRLGEPQRWWTMVGDAPIIGADHIRQAALSRRPAELVETPLDWLRRGGKAACIIDWDCDPRIELDGPPIINCASKKLAERLHRRIAALLRPKFDVTVAA